MAIWKFQKTPCRWLSCAQYGRFTKRHSLCTQQKMHFIDEPSSYIKQFLKIKGIGTWGQRRLRFWWVSTNTRIHHTISTIICDFLEIYKIHILCTLCLLEELPLTIWYGLKIKQLPIWWRVTYIVHSYVNMYIFLNRLPFLILTWDQKI